MALQFTIKPRKTVTINGKQYTIDPNDMRGIVVPGPVITPTYNWTAFFPGAYLVIQSNLGHTYGTITKASNGGGPVGTLSGQPAKATPILFKCTTGGAIGAGAVFSVYYDGGTVPAGSNIVPAVGVPVALPGAGAGMSHAWGAGTASLNDTWIATCAQLTNLASAGAFAQATAGLQPTFAVGLGGIPSLLLDGIDDNMPSGIALPSPATTPYYIAAVLCQRSWVSSGVIFGNQGTAQDTIFQATGTPIMFQRINSIGPSNGGAAINAWVDLEINRTNSGSDPFKLGSTSVTGIVGITALTNLNLGMAGGGGGNFCSFEVLMYAVTPVLPNWANFRTQIAAVYGGGNVLA